MSLKRGQYVLVLSPTDEFDLIEIDANLLSQIKQQVRYIIQSGQTKDIGLAYIIAFTMMMQDRQLLIGEFDPDKDIMM